jgi:predicted lipoprotein
MARFVAVLFVALAACKRAEPLPTDGDAGAYKASAAAREATLRGVAMCTAAQAKAFATTASTFEQKAKALALAATEDARNEARTEARAAWEAAIDEWQKLEMMQYGPAAVATQPGGLDLRGPIYAWPLFSRCLVEQQLVSKVYDTSFSNLLANSRGLGAAEFLLFYDGSDNACGPTAAINTDGTWSALAGGDLSARRAAYAYAAVADVASYGRKLDVAWDPAQGNFVNELAKAGRGSATYKSDQLAFNSLSDALFYVESDVKDMKVARPLGIANCDKATCPEAVESPYAKRSKQHLVNNLAGFRAVFFGCATDATALDDLLIAVGAGALVAEVKAALDAADAAVAALTSRDLEAALVNENDKFRAVHAALKRLTDILRTEFVSALNLELPRRVEGDND